MDFSRINGPIFYVTPDPARAVGLEKVLPNYHIVCLDDSPLVGLMLKRRVKVFSLERALGRQNVILRNTGQILAHPLVQEYIEKNSLGEISNILFFKPSKKIEAICQKKGYRPLGNGSELNQQFEEKISFYRLCQSWGLPTPQGEIKILKSCHYQDLARRLGGELVIQFGHGWAGNTTYFVSKESDFKVLQIRFPEREVKITRFIVGETFLNNACVTGEKILISPPAIQITAPEGFTQNPGGTCGRQWPAPLEKKIKEEIEEYSQTIGEKMRKAGYRGFFGLDFLAERGSDKVYISENNARLTASVSLYTKMELLAGKTPLLLYHLLEFMGKGPHLLDLPKEKKGKEMVGAELIIRNALPKPVKVTNDFLPGIYTHRNERLKKIREGYSLEDIVDKGEFFVLAASRGRIVTSENEIARLNCLTEILDKQGEVNNWTKRALLEVKEKLGLKIDGDA